MLRDGAQSRGYYVLPHATEPGVGHDLVVGRKGFGCVCFLGTTDLSKIPAPLDSLVLFSKVRIEKNFSQSWLISNKLLS